MKVEQLMTQDVRTCRPGDSLSAAAQLMWDGDCGCIPVVSDDGSKRVIGMVTDRDVCMATHFRGRAPREVSVDEAMSTGVRAVGASEDLADAKAIMREAQVRRLPVVDEDQQLMGVLSLADLAQEADRKRKSKQSPITEQEVGDTLTAICAPKSPSQLAAPA